MKKLKCLPKAQKKSKWFENCIVFSNYFYNVLLYKYLVYIKTKHRVRGKEKFRNKTIFVNISVMYI